MSVFSDQATLGAFTKLFISGPEKRVPKVVDGQVVRDEEGKIVEEVIQWERPECPICMSAIEAGEDVYIRDACGHLFHKTCMESYARSERRPTTCPACRQIIPTRDLSKLRGDVPPPPWTVFNCAASGNIPALQALLDADPSAVNSVDAEGYTPLMLAIRNGRVKLACSLLPGKFCDKFHKSVRLIDRNIAEPRLGNTALHYACDLGGHSYSGNNFSLVVEYLIDNDWDDDDDHIYHSPVGDHIYPQPHFKANVNVQDRSGNTPLSTCAKSGNTSAARALLSHIDIDVNLADRTGWTPLMVACVWRRNTIVRCLLEKKGIDLDRKNMVGQTALDIAAMSMTHNDGYDTYIVDMIERFIDQERQVQVAAGGLAGPGPKRGRQI
jgi:hypothetical protein